MKLLIKKLWIKALKSGKYKQGTECLRKVNKFCCLGVLSDLYAKENKIKWKKDKESYRLFNEGYVLPSMVREWAGLDGHNPGVLITEKIKKKIDCNWKSSSLSNLNDKGCNFKQIAECIDKSL